MIAAANEKTKEGETVKRFPQEFEALLNPRGRAILKRPRETLRSRQERFLEVQGLVKKDTALQVAALLEKTFEGCLQPMEEPIPEWTVRAMRENYAELLPKTVRVRTALLESRRSRAWKRAEEVGLLAMLRSESFRGFAEALSGYRLKPKWGTQVLCYLPGDYTGPHNDHHPEDEEAKDGYVDVHLTFCSPGVQHQFLVYEKEQHFSHLAKVSSLGGVTCYRLPFWHYTTPLLAQPGKSQRARRWVLLGTFLDQAPRSA